jgi:hypothetical protein
MVMERRCSTSNVLKGYKGLKQAHNPTGFMMRSRASLPSQHELNSVESRNFLKIE